MIVICTTLLVIIVFKPEDMKMFKLFELNLASYIKTVLKQNLLVILRNTFAPLFKKSS